MMLTPAKPTIVFLDRATLPCDMPPLVVPHTWVNHEATAAHEVCERLQHATVAITNKVAIDAKMLDALVRSGSPLKLIAVAATGYNLVDVAAATQHGIVVCNVRGYSTQGVAEHTLMMLLALARQLLPHHQAAIDGTWAASPQFCHRISPLFDVAGKTLTIVGRGAIGQRVGELAHAFGMTVLFAERRDSLVLREGYTPWLEALACADMVSVHCPLSPDSVGLFDASAMAGMKRGAYLLNVSRGGIVDEVALLAALQSGHLAGAALDVLVTEPPANTDALLRANLPNLIITPHVAWSSEASLLALAQGVVDNIAHFLRGEPLATVVG